MSSAQMAAILSRWRWVNEISSAILNDIKWSAKVIQLLNMIATPKNLGWTGGITLKSVVWLLMA